MCFVVKMPNGSFVPLDLDIDISDVKLLIPLRVYQKNFEKCFFCDGIDGEAVVFIKDFPRIKSEYESYADFFFNYNICQIDKVMHTEYNVSDLNMLNLNNILLVNNVIEIDKKYAKRHIRAFPNYYSVFSKYAQIKEFIYEEVDKIYSGFDCNSKKQQICDKLLVVVYMNMFYISSISVELVIDAQMNYSVVLLSEFTNKKVCSLAQLVEI